MVPIRWRLTERPSDPERPDRATSGLVISTSERPSDYPPLFSVSLFRRYSSPFSLFRLFRSLRSLRSNKDKGFKVSDPASDLERPLEPR